MAQSDWERRQKPVLGIRTRVNVDDGETVVTEIKRNSIMLSNGAEVSHETVEFCLYLDKD